MYALRVLIADDDRVTREALRLTLQAGGLECVGAVADGREVVERARELRPDVVLMDVVMPGIDGLTATRSLMMELPEIDCVLLTATPHIGDSVRGMEAGAAAYFPKDLVALERLVPTLRALCADPRARERRRRRRTVLALRGTWPALLEEAEWRRLELAIEEGSRPDDDVAELLDRLEAGGDPRAAAVRTAMLVD